MNLYKIFKTIKNYNYCLKKIYKQKFLFELLLNIKNNVKKFK